MKILALSTYDNLGGAARAAYRLHQGLNSIGIDSRMFVQTKTTDDPKITGPNSQMSKGIAIFRPFLDSLPLKVWAKTNRPQFSSGIVPESMASVVCAEHPDIVHLHWISGGFLRVESLRRFKRPIVWTLHDMWAFTGGCHYSGQCRGFQKTCGACPMLGSQKGPDLSSWNLSRKLKAISGLNLTIVTPSKWLGECARSSELFRNVRVETIPHGLDLNRYRPIPQAICRELLSLPADKKLIGFGAVKSTRDARKGFQFLAPSLRQVSDTLPSKDAELVVFGSSRPEPEPDLGLRTHYMGELHDDVSLTLLYNSCDVFVAPSTEDNLPNTVMEAMACGTPCVAFDVGGMSDIIEHQSSGYLARPFAIEDFSRGITGLLTNEEQLRKCSALARKKVELEYSLEQIANRYRDLYNGILTTKGFDS